MQILLSSQSSCGYFNGNKLSEDMIGDSYMIAMFCDKTHKTTSN